MELKPGYKLTEVGIIPDDWDIRRIGDISNPVRGSSPRPAGDTRYFNGSFIPWLTVASLTNIPESQLAVVETESCLTEEGSKFSRILDLDTLIIANSGATLGVAKILGIRCCANDGIAALLDLEKDASGSFIAHYINAQTSYLREAVATGNGQPNLNTTLIRNLTLPFPPNTEQNAIAEVLSGMDDLIESLENLIVKKRQIKQGAMHELLRPKPTWVQKRLDEIAKIRSGGTPSTTKPEYWGGELLWCTPTDITALEGGKYISATEKCITNQGLKSSSAELIPANSIVMTTRATIGECAINLSPITTNQGFKNFLPLDHIDVEFLYYLLLTKKQDLIGLCIGSTFLEISKTQLSALEIQLPLDKAEQFAIASILAEIDVEIVTCEKKLAKARQIKQGMMQVLLTGKIRLIEPKSTVVQFPAKEKAAAASTKGHNSAINEAVVISVLTKKFGSEQYPLGRKRYTKLSYLLHRHAEGNAEGYLEKAAGPYNPSTKYKGAEKIALSNRYVRSHARDNFSGFVAAEKIGEAEGYFAKWYGNDAIEWLEQFRYKKNDELELLATTDMAMVNLERVNKSVNLASVKQYLTDAPEWTAKLNRSVFSDENIETAIKWSRQLFGNRAS